MISIIGEREREREREKRIGICLNIRGVPKTGSSNVKRVFRVLFDDLLIVGGSEGVKQLTAINQLNDKAVHEMRH